MRAIMVMFDSLNRRMLEPYGCDWVKTPNFRRLAERAVAFDNCYVGSMPCMPARREIHTGRYNFLHCPWGPLEPFDDSMPSILRDAGIYTHLVSDHYHYWEEGGCTYHTKYNSWEFPRGQEGDPWKGVVGDIEVPPNINGKGRRQDWVNRRYMQREEDQPQTRSFKLGLEFLQTNRERDNWFLTIETFDPHEPFYVPQRFRDLYPDGYSGPLFDWPGYRPVTETPEQVRHVRNLYAALVTMCDENLGRVLDAMDRYRLWDDTLLIVNTDHGFLLGEHGLWAKNYPPMYNEIANIPFFVWDPRHKVGGARRRSLVQTIDIAPTVLDFFGVPAPRDMQGVPLGATVAADAPVRAAALYGTFGHYVNCTDGRHVYMRGPRTGTDSPIYQYTLAPWTLRWPRYQAAGGAALELADPLPFTKGSRLLKMRVEERPRELPHLLFDLEADPAQARPIADAEGERRMCEHIASLMRANAAPPELFERLGLAGAAHR